MTTLTSSQTPFLPTVEEPENNRINFRDSLKFFQEQLVINGANFPSPSSGCQSGKNTLKRSVSFSFKENSSGKTKITKDNDAFKEEIQPSKSCKIAIPTVDTILESVRVLRAIQKSQEERGSFWDLDVSPKSDIGSYFSYGNDEITITNLDQNVHFNQDPDKEQEKETYLVTSEDKQAKDQFINPNIPEMEVKVSELQADIEIDLTNVPYTKAEEETCSFWPSNSLAMNDYSETEIRVKDSPLPLETISERVNPEYYEIENKSTEAFGETELNIKEVCNSNENQINAAFPGQLEENNEHEYLLANSTENESKLKNDFDSKEIHNNNESLSHLEINVGHENLMENTAENSQLKNESNSSERPNTENLNNLEQNNNYESLSNSKENKFGMKNGSNTDDYQNVTDIGSQMTESDILIKIATEISTENKNESKNTVSDDCNVLETLSEDSTDFLDFRNVTPEVTTKEILLKKINNENDLLKIETYQDTDAQKPDVYILNGSEWKSCCSPNDRSSIKTEPNDSDSGLGTQRSGSSLSPNNYSQIQKDSWSDSCSSQYASAECSPYHSLSSVFECSSLLSTVGEAKTNENLDILPDSPTTTWEEASEKVKDLEKDEVKNCDSVPQNNINNNAEINILPDKCEGVSSNEFVDFELHSGNAELDTEISYCNFITNYTIESPCKRTDTALETNQQISEVSVNSVTDAEHITDEVTILQEQTAETNKDEFVAIITNGKKDELDDSCDLSRTQKFTAASCDLISIVQSLYTIRESTEYQLLPTLDEYEEKFEEKLFVLSRGAFCEFPEDNYLVTIEDSTLHIKKDSEYLCSLDMKYAEVSIMSKNLLEIDNKMGKSVYIQSDTDNLMHLKSRIEINVLKHWQTDCLQLVHYPLKCHQNVVIIDLGSCSTRAGILMDQPTLPSLFFPTICATNKSTGTSVYGMEALQSEVRQHSNLSFPVRPTNKITKHTINIELLEGLFKKIFSDLKIDPTEYTIQVCLPRNLSINAQTALMTLLLEDLKVKAISLTNQALLTLYAHEVSTAVVVDIGDRIDVLPVVDGFIVETGVTKLPHGGQRLIHHMKHGLAEKRISLSNEIDSFVVQYITENLAYVAEDYEKEIEIATRYPDRLKKTVTLQPASSEKLSCKTITLEEARFKIPEGLFNPDFWGLDSSGIHHLVQKAIQATSVDARKQIAENIYVSGGVTMLPGFVERLSKEMIKLSKTKIVPKVHASNYRYHCTYIGACKFAKMDVFPQVCVNLEDYSKNGASELKKCSLCF